MSKNSWSKLLWGRAWQIADIFWQSSRVLFKDNELLHVHGSLACSRYVLWWQISDKQQRLIKMCENMAKLVSHAGRLRCDDVLLKGLTPGFRYCTFCDLYEPGTPRHLIMQCPTFEITCAKIFRDLYTINENLFRIFNKKFIGKSIPETDSDRHNV